MCLLIILFGLVLSLKSKGQCPLGDECGDNAVEVDTQGMDPGDVLCVPYPLCNGKLINANLNLINWYCDDEDGGDPQGCSSSTSVEHDFWVRIVIHESWVYTFRFDSNYANNQYPQLSGAQMWIYDDCFWLTMLASANCDQELETDLFMDVYLDPGVYYLQIDGFGQSYGCGDLCVYRQGFLGLSVDEHTKQISMRKNGLRYNILGQRIK